MSTNHEEEVVDYDELRRMGYDRRDVSLKSFNKMIFWFFAITTAFIPLTWGIIWGLERVFGNRLPAKPVSLAHMQPNAPLLQSDVTVLTDIRDLRLKEEEGLAIYRWVDQSKGLVSIPIQLGMNELAKRGTFGPLAAPAAPTGANPGGPSTPLATPAGGAPITEGAAPSGTANPAPGGTH